MAKRPTVTTISSGYASNTQLNSNFTAIRNAFDNTLSLDGSTPNAMTADLDLNGNALLNVGSIDADNLTLNGQTVTELSSVPEWRSAWLTGTSYVKNDLVSEAGSSYICLVDHTAGTFSTDLIALKWELFAQKGAAGAGAGDMVGSNNLSDVTNVATARANLGLGTMATQNATAVAITGGTVVGITDLAIADGGTGASDAATARTNLGLSSVATASLSSQAQAEAGTDNTTLMTPLRASQSPVGAPHAVLEDQQASGVAGPTPTANTWINRRLNTEVRDPTGFVTLTSNQFVVTAAGWCEWEVVQRDTYSSRLYNVTDAAVVNYGTSMSTGTGGGMALTGVGGGALIAGKTYEIQFNSTGTLGVSAASRGTEVYLRVKLWRTT